MRRYREFQSGLLFVDERRKPSYATFQAPIVITGRRVWGQVRPGTRHTVTIERHAGRSFRRVARVRTDVRGYFQSGILRRRADYRYRWEAGASQIQHYQPK